jgi:hypothetical protein
MRECRECRWVAVVDGTGRRRLEMRWQKATARSDAPQVRAA